MGDVDVLTLKGSIAKILLDDLASEEATSLGTWCGYNAESKPNVVFYQYPPETAKPPVISYQISAEQGVLPRNIYLDVTVWGSHFHEIHDRVYDLIHERFAVAATSYRVVGFRFESASAELYDETLHCYFQRQRYRVITIRT
jgi:hypothetical protein